ncbi:MAG: hypothetical protein JKX97_06125 [Candidatus Lindowbacteria bacterium]|nr:hypothetical protein [Candidatus Lindowbacteria bacterium]
MKKGRFTQNTRTIRAALRFLKKKHKCYLVKISTEDEGLTHEDVAERYKVMSSEIEVELKIGGPGARGDLKFAKQLGIKTVIVPMVESSYAMRDFINSVHEVLQNGSKKQSLKGWHIGVNIETSGAYKNLGGILAEDADILKQVTVGRSDLSKSMGSSVDDPRVLSAAKSIVRKARKKGYFTSIGGGIVPSNVDKVIKSGRSHAVNTRNFGFKVPKKGSLRLAIRDALLVEMMICSLEGTTAAASRKDALSARMSDEDFTDLDPTLLKLLDKSGVVLPC